jgi:hypothetical protein
VPSLRELQRRLAVVFTHPRGVRPGLTAAGFDARRRPVTRVVADRPPVPLHTRLAVYSDAYFLRLAECLGDDFRAVKRALGADDFQRLAADYLAVHPSRSPFINDAGAAFPAFLKGHPFAQAHPFLPDLAALERFALVALFTDRLPAEDLTRLAPASRLRLDPTVRLLETGWPVDRLWIARSLPDGRGLRRLAAPARRRLLLWRDDAWARVRALDDTEWLVLERLAAGRTLEQALKGLEKKTAPAVLRGWFARWTADGVLKGLRN